MIPIDFFFLDHKPISGILPDIMHIAHLSLFPDAYCSVLLDLSDDQTFFPQPSRDGRLRELWESYRNWCEVGGVQVQ